MVLGFLHGAMTLPCCLALLSAAAASPTPPPTACPAPAPNARPPYPYPTHTNPAWPTGGFPPLPWADASDAASWTMRAATFANFLGNDTGPMNPALLHNVSALGLAGLGWEMGDHLPTDPAGVINPQQIGKLEERQSVAAAALKRLRPGVRVLSSADIACTAAFWRVSQAAMANASLAAQLFLHWPNGTLFLDSWGDTPAPWWNFSNPVAVDFWIQQGPIATAMADPNIDGVCATPHPAHHHHHAATITFSGIR